MLCTTTTAENNTAKALTPKTAEERALADELLTYEIKIDENANDRYGAFSTGTHDDLVTALGLACQVDSSGLDVWSA